MAKKTKKDVSESFLKERKMKILGCIIESYIETAEPVGSKTMCRKYRMKYSPATIRNVMAELEHEGLITHPHTSAGRIPTDKGYRYFVDFVMKPYPLAPQEQAYIRAQLAHAEGSVEALLHRVLEVVSRFTDELTVGVTPEIRQSVFKHIELVPLSQRKILSTLLTQEGIVKNSILSFDADFTGKEIERINNYMNQTLSGQSVDEIVDYMHHKILEAQDTFYYMFKKAMDIFETISSLEESHIWYTGLENLFQQPELQDAHTARELMKLLEGKNSLLEAVAGDGSSAAHVEFLIGKENKYKPLYLYTIARASYRMGGKNFGMLGIIGPTRMSYPKVSSVLDFTCREVEKIFEKEF